MSSRLHQDKSLEEIEPLIEAFILQYRKTFGREPDFKIIASKLEKLRLEKEEEVFQALFGTLTPKNLHDCQKLIETIGRNGKSNKAHKST